MAIQDENKYPLQNPPRFPANDKVQQVSNLNPDGAGAPYPRRGPVTTPAPGMTAGLGNLVRNTDGNLGQARQAEIAKNRPGPGPGYKPSAPPGDWD